MTLRFLTAGESHGQALVGILEGLPAGLALTTEALHTELRRRKLGFGRGARQSIETDAITLMSGVRLGQTLGSPIAVVMPNKDWEVWQHIMQVEPDASGFAQDQRRVEVPRPGHADRVGGVKYAHADMRNVLERSSARETAMRVALGSIARLFLAKLDIHIASRVVRIGEVQDTSTEVGSVATLNARTDSSMVRCLSDAASTEMVRAITEAGDRGDTLGGAFEVIVAGAPVGLGSYAHWDRRLEADIGKAFLSLNAIKGVEVGLGFAVAHTPGSLAHDGLNVAPSGAVGRTTYATNRAGGIEGGMSTGQPIVVRAAMKPLSTLQKPLPSVHLAQGIGMGAHVERSDVCAVPAAAVIGESLMALVMAQAILEKFGGDSMSELLPRIAHWRAQADAAGTLPAV